MLRGHPNIVDLIDADAFKVSPSCGWMWRWDRWDRWVGVGEKADLGCAGMTCAAARWDARGIDLDGVLLWSVLSSHSSLCNVTLSTDIYGKLTSSWAGS
jgi:hypothetical protein